MKEYIKLAVVALIGGLLSGLLVVGLVGGNQSNSLANSLGGIGTRMIHGLSTDSTSPADGEMRTTLLTVTSTSTVGNLSTVVSYGTCANATTSLFAVLNPFAATSTAKNAIVDISATGATTASLTVSTSTNVYGLPPGITSAATTSALINMAPLMASTSPYIRSGITTSLSDGAAFSPNYATTTGGIASRSEILVKPGEYLVGSITPYGGYGSTLGWTHTTNAAACTYKIEWSR